MLRVLRSTLFSVVMIVLTVFFATGTIFLRPLPFILTSRFLQLYARLTINSLRLLCNVDYEIQGRENIPAAPFIIFSKHQSTWETFALQIIFLKICYVVKRELFLIPFFGWGLAAMRPIAIDRGAGKHALNQIIHKGTRRLQQGISVVIFPEGTRTTPDRPGKYKIGGALLAAHSGYPIVPVAHNAGECWQRGGFIKKPGIIRVRIGPVITTKDKSPEHILAQSKAWIESQMPSITRVPYQTPTPVSDVG
ncbi:MAG: 1-acyl-sn-glycerol-3-phosphate acyltransferase [Gammaproteobacteria bacterium]|nr:1-acyl-sn-glycerol-3-phosphate acyltransferase [Gammaproteobacteria bacterium]